MMLPICEFDAKNMVLCPQCESNVESGIYTRSDVDAAFILARLAVENPEIDGFSLEKCMVVDGNYIIYLKKNDIQTIRQSKTLYGAIQAKFTGKIWLVESGADDKRFIRDLFFPIKILSINIVWAPGGVQRTKVVVLGRHTHKFPINLDNARRIIRDLRDRQVDIEFEESKG